MSSNSLFRYLWGSAFLAATLFGLSAAPLIAQPRSDDKSAGGARAVLVEPIHDFGPIDYGETVTHDFVIRNDGGALLEILDVRSSCGCTVVEVDEGIPAGGTGRVRVELDSREQTGAFAVFVDVITNDPVNQRLKLTVKAELERRVQVRPGYVRWLAYRGSEEGRGTTHSVWAADGGELRVTGVDAPAFVAASFHPAGAEERNPRVDAAQWIVEARLIDDAPVGPVTGSLVVRVDHASESEVRIPIRGFVHDVVVANPDDLYFGEVLIGGGIESSVRLSIHEAGVTITGVSTTVLGVELELLPTEAATEFQVMVRLTRNLLAGAFEGVVRIDTTSADLPVLELPISGTAL